MRQVRLGNLLRQFDWHIGGEINPFRTKDRRKFAIESLEERRVLAAPVAVDDVYYTPENTAITAGPESLPPSEVMLVPHSAIWNYLDDGSDLGVAWRASGYDDSGWNYGSGEFGYGDGDEATVVGYGGDSWQKHITTYFRHAFDVEDLASLSPMTMWVKRDDGVAIFLNGTEVVRDNLPPNAGASTPASSVASNDGNFWVSFTVNPALLVSGRNVLAAEVHQVDG